MEITKLNLELQEKLIVLLIYCIFIVLANSTSHGRISRNRFLKVEIIKLFCTSLYWVFAISMLRFFNIQVFCILGIIVSLISCYISIHLEILRFHDLGYSGWYSFMFFIPLINLYFLWIIYVKKRDDLLNDFDKPVDYLKFLKDNELYPVITLIKLDEKDFSVNGIKFEYKEHKGHTQYAVSSIALEEMDNLKEYCEKNLIVTENVPGLAGQNMLFFLDDGLLLKRIKTDLNAIISKGSLIKLHDIKMFIRNNFGLYEIVYQKTFADKVESFSSVENIENFCCQTLTKNQVIGLIKSSARGLI